MTTFTPQGTEFDNFLFAPILEQNGVPLSVLSALTRQSIDPWQEAARLGKLSGDEAINSLAATIWKLDGVALSPEQASILASRLVRLLPPARKSVTTSNKDAADSDLLMMFLVYGIFMGMAAISSSPTHQTLDASQRAMSLQETTVSQSSHAKQP